MHLDALKASRAYRLPASNQARQIDFVLVQPPPLPETQCRIVSRTTPGWKRGLDLCGVALATPLLAPGLLLVALYIKLVSPGPVLFIQPRVGWGGDDFLIYKFRTMHVPAVSRDGPHRDYLLSQAGLPHPNKKPDYGNALIPGGKWLRKLSIDELPQLLNVFQGNMSLVGPRPDLLQLADYQPWQLRRFEVLPGMTGLWQVSGKNRLSFEQMIDLDIQYIETRSLWRDLRILARTVFVVLWNRNE